MSERIPASASADAVVVGAGIIGSSIALELARGGRTVVCVDKGPAPGAGSTSSSSSIIRFSYSTMAGVLASWESAALWLDWAGHLGVVDPAGMARFVRTGGIVFRSEGYDTDVITALWDEVGVPYERLSAAQVRERHPALDVGAYFPPRRVDDPAFGAAAHGELDAVSMPDAGYIDDPMLAAHNLAHAAQHHGATFRFRTEVVGVERSGGAVAGVRLADGAVVAAPVVVNAAGPWSTKLNALAGVAGELRIGTRALRQEVFVVPAPDGLALGEGGTLVADLDLGQYFRPHAGGTMLVGGTEPECDPLEWVDDPDTALPDPTRERWETTMLRLGRRVPSFGVPPHPVGLAACYDVADDWVPIYDRTSLAGYYLACGTSGNQFKNGPLVGSFLRTLIDAVAAGADHDAEPVRFSGQRTGRAIDLGAFSRLRTPAITSGNVMG